jgi:hypothetical protein
MFINIDDGVEDPVISFSQNSAGGAANNLN